MVEKHNEQLANTDSLLKFLDQNQEVDFLTYKLNDEVSLNQLNFKNLEDKKEEITFQVKAFQRLIRIIPENDKKTALTLMSKGIHSALQIAAMTRKDFLSRCDGTLSKELTDKIYRNALAKRSAILVQYMNKMQNNEPHINSAKFH